MTFAMHEASATTRASLALSVVILGAARVFDGQCVRIAHATANQRLIAMRAMALDLREPIHDCSRVREFVTCPFSCCHVVSFLFEAA